MTWCKADGEPCITSPWVLIGAGACVRVRCNSCGKLSRPLEAANAAALDEVRFIEIEQGVHYCVSCALLGRKREGRG